MTHLTGTSMLPTPPRKEYGPGDVISDKYRLVQLLGEGGMGSVWVAENMALKANIALKLIRADVAEGSANERFLSEARLAARLQHAAIVRVFDFGKTAQDEPFIVMELLEGETLGQRLTRLGCIDATELFQMLLPIIDALHSAHGHGVIHRDLKPDNVFIAKADGGGVQPKLLDFGIAKLRGESAFLTTKLTQAGTLIGSPDYMSPEQARGETDLDPRSDVWALCVLAYECLVGKPPFHGDNYNALLWAIIHDEPVPITVFQAGDSELWRLLKTGFSKDRTARWESARKFGEAIAQWLENKGVVEDVCNRSLHASWLPAERPTRPELAPFDAMSPPPLRSSQAAMMVPATTVTGLRRPRTLSLWFAGVGLLTLLGAMIFVGRSQDGGAAPSAASASADMRTEPLRTQPVAEGTPPSSANAPPATLPPTHPAEEPGASPSVPPIAQATTESNAARSWTSNHERSARDVALAEEFRDRVKGTDGHQDEAPKHQSPKPGAAKAGASHPKPKKTPLEKTDVNDFDFGI
jgi:eukaryotic-like serine/threonine-protein kinase